MKKKLHSGALGTVCTFEVNQKDIYQVNIFLPTNFQDYFKSCYLNSINIIGLFAKVLGFIKWVNFGQKLGSKIAT